MILVPATWEYVTLQGRRDSACVIDLRTMRWGDDPGLCRWAQCNHWGPFQGSREMRDHRKDGMVDSRMMLHELRNAGGLQKLKEERKWTPHHHRVPQEGCSPVLILAVYF